MATSRTASARTSAPDRGGPKAGIAFAVLSVVAAGLMLYDIPAPVDSDATIRAYYHDTTALALSAVGMFMWTAAAACFAWFALRWRDTLREAEGGTGRLSEFAHFSSTIFVVLYLVGGVGIGTVAGALLMGNADPSLSPEFMRVLPQFAFGILRGPAGVFDAIFIVTSSVLILRTGVLPKWTARAGFVCAAISMVIITPVPLIAIPAWIGMLSVAQLRASVREATVGATVAQAA